MGLAFIRVIIAFLLLPQTNCHHTTGQNDHRLDTLNTVNDILTSIAETTVYVIMNQSSIAAEEVYIHLVKYPEQGKILTPFLVSNHPSQLMDNTSQAAAEEGMLVKNQGFNTSVLVRGSEKMAIYTLVHHRQADPSKKCNQVPIHIF